MFAAQTGLGQGQKEGQCCESGREMGRGRESPIQPESPQLSERTKENPEDFTGVEGRGDCRRGACLGPVSSTGGDGPPWGSSTGGA